MITQKAKKLIKKYRVCVILIFLLTIILYVLTTFFIKNFFLFPVTILLLFTTLFCCYICFNKYIKGSLHNDLDGHLYREIIKQGKFFDSGALWQISGEYFSGNYENVIELCNRNLSNPKTAKKYSINYYLFLLNVYFDTGNDEKLSETLKIFDKCLLSIKKSKKKRLAYDLARVDYYRNYLIHDYDSCKKYVDADKTTNLEHLRSAFFKARILLCQKESEKAKVLFQYITETTDSLNYTKLSKNGLDSINKKISYKDTFDEIIPNKEVIIYKQSKAKRILRKVVAVLFLISFLFTTIIYSYLFYLNVKQVVFHLQYKKKIHEYNENIRVLVEEEYDEVEILHNFNLEYNGQIADSMFICKTDKSILFCSVYSYKNDKELHFDVKHEILISNLDTLYETPDYMKFKCTTTNLHAYGYCYTNTEKLPDDYIHISTVTVNDKTLYFVITKMELQN